MTENRRILIVDDNTSIHEDFRKILGGGAEATNFDSAAADLFGEAGEKDDGQPSFELSSAYQGEQALEMAKTAVEEHRPFSMAFVDVRIPPGWDGVTTVRHIWEVDPHLQVVICTAYSDYSWDEMLARLGVTDRLLILKKPFDNIEVRQLACSLSKKWNFGLQARQAMEGLQSKVAERTAQLQGVLDAAMDGIITVDQNGDILSGNPAAAEILAVPSNELPEKQIQVFVDDKHAVDIKNYLAHPTNGSDENSTALRVEVAGVRADGSRIPIDFSMNAFQVGERRLFTVILRDLTEQNSLQTRLLQAEKLQSIGQLAAGVAHEINTPNQFLGDNIRFLRDSFGELDSLLDACDQLVKQAQDESAGQERMQQIKTLSQGVEIDYLRREIPNAIEQSLEGVENVARIVGSMKEFSHPGGMGKVSYDLNKAILNTLTVVQSRTKDVAEVITELDVNLPPTACLPNEFNQVILNIVVNAADAIAEHRQGERGEIRVTTHLHGDTVEIRIHDNGGGIPLEHQCRVFDPFFTTKEVGKGTGQGLSIAHSIIVDKHGGEFSLESTPGEGSTFIIRLPIQDEEDVFEEDALQECEATA